MRPSNEEMKHMYISWLINASAKAGTGGRHLEVTDNATTRTVNNANNAHIACILLILGFEPCEKR